MNAWHTLTKEKVLAALQTSEHGLNKEQVQLRLQQHGANELVESGRKSALRMLWEQLTETMVLILITAALASAFLGKTTETIAILAIVLLFAILGFVQEYRAEKAMQALRQLAVPVVRVRRDGELLTISAHELVPGDIVHLEAGSAVPADLRVLESVNLRVQEATLTGEAEAVEKRVEPLQHADLPLGDRSNMLYLGTSVSYGRGSAVVAATGMQTELGKIASLIQEVAAEQTPLQKKLDELGKTLAVAGMIAAVMVLIVGLLSGETLAEMLLTAVSVAVAVVPEGLPAVVTITLALGAQRMLQRNALIRKLPAVETLGAVTVICSDKTGTLTENRMTVTLIDVAGQKLDLVQDMRHHQPAIQDDACLQIAPQATPAPIRLALTAGALCNDAVLKAEDRPGCFHALGDPTEGALLIAAAQRGVMPESLQKHLPRINELPFDSNRKRMTTLHRLPAAGELSEPLVPFAGLRAVAFTKGAVDGMLTITSQVWHQDHIEPLSPEWRERIASANDDLAKNGRRVLGIAMQLFDHIPDDAEEALEKELIFIGLVGLMDPPRAAVKSAIATSKAAGIRTVMITGDHPLTALAIARDLGITENSGVVTGEMLNQMSDQQLLDVVQQTAVFARVSPEDKLRIVNALQQRGHVTAMTGDGVNDSPALKKADIGVAMGITGTDVAKEAADMVLLDDNFNTIVAAIEEGRVIYNNLVRFIKFSLGGNLGKVLVMLGAPLFGINIALRPLQLLWLNLLTDGLMGLGLGLEPAEKSTMQQPPRAPNAPVLDWQARIHVSWVGILIAALTLGLGFYFFRIQAASDKWQTIIFAALGFSQIGHALGLRAAGQAPLSLKSNPSMTILAIVTFLLQLAVIYIPWLDRFFELTPLSALELGLAGASGILTFAGVWIEKRMTAQRVS